MDQKYSLHSYMKCMKSLHPSHHIYPGQVLNTNQVIGFFLLILGRFMQVFKFVNSSILFNITVYLQYTIYLAIFISIKEIIAIHHKKPDFDLLTYRMALGCLTFDFVLIFFQMAFNLWSLAFNPVSAGVTPITQLEFPKMHTITLSLFFVRQPSD